MDSNVDVKEIIVKCEVYDIGTDVEDTKDIKEEYPQTELNTEVTIYDYKEKENKATRKRITLETKMQVLKRLDAGERQSDIGTALNLSTSTIRTIFKNKEKIVSSATTTTKTSATRITRSRSNVFEEMEKRLSIWIDGEVERNKPVSQAIVMKKARTLFKQIQKEKGDKSENFVASRGWFHRFKKRNNFHNIRITGEAASGNTKTATAVPESRLNNINTQAVEELLQVSNGNLKELEQQVHKDENQKKLSTDFLKKSLGTITKIMDQFVQNDSNIDRSSKARQSVIDAMSCYQQLLAERTRKKQTALGDSFTKKQKISDEEEPSSSQTT